MTQPNMEFTHAALPILWDSLLPLRVLGFPNAGKLLSRSPISKKNDVVTCGSPATHQRALNGRLVATIGSVLDLDGFMVMKRCENYS